MKMKKMEINNIPMLLQELQKNREDANMVNENTEFQKEQIAKIIGSMHQMPITNYSYRIPRKIRRLYWRRKIIERIKTVFGF